MQQLPRNHFFHDLKTPKPTMRSEIAFSPWTAAITKPESPFWDDKDIQNYLEYNNFGILRSETIRRALHLIASAFLWIPYIIIKAVHKGIVKNKNKDAQTQHMCISLMHSTKIIQENQQRFDSNQHAMNKKLTDVTNENIALKALLPPIDKSKKAITNGLQNLPNMLRGRMNICFLNSPIQCFAHIPVLKEFIKNCNPNPACLALKTTLVNLLNELDNENGDYFKINDLHLAFIKEVKKTLVLLKTTKAKQAKQTGAKIPNNSGFKLNSKQQDPAEFIGWLLNRLVTNQEYYKRPSSVEEDKKETFDKDGNLIRIRTTTSSLPEFYIPQKSMILKVQNEKVILDLNPKPSTHKEQCLYNLNHKDKKFLSYISPFNAGKEKTKKQIKKEIADFAKEGYSVGQEVHTTTHKTNIAGQKFLFIRNSFTGVNLEGFPPSFYLPNGKKFNLEGAICHTVGKSNPKAEKMASSGHYIAKVKTGSGWLNFNDLGYRYGVLGQQGTAPTKGSDHGFLYIYTLESEESSSSTPKKT